MEFKCLKQCMDLCDQNKNIHIKMPCTKKKSELKLGTTRDTYESEFGHSVSKRQVPSEM